MPRRSSHSGGSAPSSHSAGPSGSSHGGGSSGPGAGKGMSAEPEALDSMSSKLSSLGSNLEQHGSTMGSAHPGSSAFGVVGQGFASKLQGVIGQGSEHVSSVGKGAHGASSKLKATSGDLRENERRNSAMFSKIHADADPPSPTGAHGPGITTPSSTAGGHVSRPPVVPGASGGASGGASRQPDARWEGAPLVVATDPNNKNTKHYIRPGDVNAVPLQGHSGKVDGVSFPSKPTDEATVTKWANRPNRHSDQQYRPGVSAPGTGVNKTSSIAAGWKDPFYVHAHANANFYGVNVDTPNGPTKMRLDGQTHGQVVAGNQYYQQVVGQNSNRPLVYMSCNSAYPGGSAASGSANYLHGAGYGNDVYAPTGTGMRYTNGDNSHYGVQSSNINGNPVSGEFKKFPGQQPANPGQTP